MRLLIHARAWEARYKRSKAQALVMNSSVRLRDGVFCSEPS